MIQAVHRTAESRRLYDLWDKQVYLISGLDHALQHV